MRRATLLSWAFVGDMNWAKTSQRRYAIGSTWEPLWSRISWKNDENLNNFGFFWWFLKSMRRATLLSQTFVGDMDWAKSSQHPYAIGLTWEPLWNRIAWEKNYENLNNFDFFWPFLKSMWQATLLSWAFVEDMNWVKSSQHPYAIGLTWEPIWSRMLWEETIKVEEKFKISFPWLVFFLSFFFCTFSQT